MRAGAKGVDLGVRLIGIGTGGGGGGENATHRNQPSRLVKRLVNQETAGRRGAKKWGIAEAWGYSSFLGGAHTPSLSRPRNGQRAPAHRGPVIFTRVVNLSERFEHENWDERGGAVSAPGADACHKKLEEKICLPGADPFWCGLSP